MTTGTPDSNVDFPLVRQRWQLVSFIHWRCPTQDIARHLPDGLTVDEYDGSAWLSITPLELAAVRARGLPAVPGLSRFPETNLRTYVRGRDGKAGLWFFSLDAGSRWITLSAPLLLGLPYLQARLSIESTDGDLRYRGVRADGKASYDIRIRPGHTSAADERDRWLTDRWRAYTQHAGRLWEVPVTHEPWLLRSATSDELSESLTASAGVPPPADPLLHFSEGVRDVAFGMVRRA